MTGVHDRMNGVFERASESVGRISPARVRQRLDRRTAAGGGLATLGLAAVAGGLSAGRTDPEWLAVVAASTVVALGLYLVGWGLIAVVIAQIAVAAVDPGLARLAGLEAAIVALTVGALLARGLDRRTIALAIVAASVAATAVLAAQSIAPPWALAAGVGLVAVGLAGLVHRVAVVTVGDPE
ncbi:hypothetical protein [Halococcoides cellulosivorans]|uniref:Uncharacterized protein n=1 Tax=Halococcoides cellulosivorans TaxID=1679096 RepID=A0A2R4X425_9EURY|nr:hypothetical protein [Halococcoides cellulosivorans]AWB28552.1 hypothetical protein HARCEL1_13110 [Halococcoides cellulosivorans]